jgi:hypothetical protein
MVGESTSQLKELYEGIRAEANRLRYLFFKNFGDTEERIEKAILNYELAEIRLEPGH